MTIDKLLLKETDKCIYGERGTYKITHIEKPELFYIGSATKIGDRIHKRGFYSRWSCHLSDLRKNIHHSPYLQNIVNKYGLNGLRFEILKICLTKEECIDHEQYLLDTLNPPLNTLKVAYSSLGFKHTEENKKAMSEKMKGKKRGPMSEEHKAKMREIGKLRDLSYLRTSEIRAKVSEKAKGRPITCIDYEKLRVKVYQFTILGIFIKSYDSMTIASRETNIDRGSINNCALGKRKSCGGFMWSYTEKPPNTPIGRKIAQYDTDMNLIDEFAYLSQVMKKLGITSPTAIRNCFSGKQKQAYGFFWKEIFD